MNLNIGELEQKSGLTGEEIDIDEDDGDEEAEEEEEDDDDQFEETYQQRQLDGQRIKQDFEG